jgi:hypothetical protein
MPQYLQAHARHPNVERRFEHASKCGIGSFAALRLKSTHDMTMQPVN